MKLIVGLGNPGKEYENTRHNIGFYFIDSYAKSKGVEINTNKFNGLYVKYKDIILLKPQSYINLSGEVIRKYLDYFKINIEDLLIINDDLDLTVGSIRLRESGSTGGHNGLKNIELNLATRDYKRLKIGISNNKDMDTKDYVLSKINSEDAKIYKSLEDTINNLIDDFIIYDFSYLMNRYNIKR